MQSNRLRGLLAEFGEVMCVGRVALNRAIEDILHKLGQRLRSLLIETLREQWQMLGKLDAQIEEIEKRLKTWMTQDKACIVGNHEIGDKYEYWTSCRSIWNEGKDDPVLREYRTRFCCM